MRRLVHPVRINGTTNSTNSIHHTEHEQHQYQGSVAIHMTQSQGEIRLVDKKEFEAFSSSVLFASFCQSAAAIDRFQKIGRTIRPYLYFYQGKPRFAALFTLDPFLPGRLRAHALQGPVFLPNPQDPETDKKILQMAFHACEVELKKEHVSEIVYNPSFFDQEHLVKEDKHVPYKNYEAEILTAGLKQASYQQDPLDNSMVYGVSRSLFVKSLEDIHSEQELLKTYTPKCRNHLRKAQKEPLAVREATEEDYPFFAHIMQVTANRKDFEDRGEEFYGTYVEAYRRYGAKLYIAELDRDRFCADSNQQIECDKELIAQFEDAGCPEDKKPSADSAKKARARVERLTKLVEQLKAETCTSAGKLPIAGSLFTSHSFEMNYLFSGSYARYMSLNAPTLLLHRALLDAVDLGCRRFNFYGTPILPETMGVYTFKKGFGGRLLEQSGVWRKDFGLCGALLRLRRKLKQKRA